MQNKNLAALYRNRFPENEMARKNAIWKVLAHDYLQKFIKIWEAEYLKILMPN